MNNELLICTEIRILCEKFKEKGKTLYHNFIDYRKAFDRVWQEALWAVMKKHNIDHKLVDMIMALYDDTKSTVQVDNTLTDWFKSTVGVRQGCLLSPYLFNIFLEQIMSEALEGFETAVSINGKPITNLRFADDIALITDSMEKLSELTERLDKASAEMGMEINGEKCKIMQIGKKNNMQDADNIDIQVGNHTIEKVNDFKYLGAYISDNARCEKEIKTRSGADPDRCNRCRCIGQFHMIDNLEVCAAEFLSDAKHLRSFEMPPSFWCNCSYVVTS